MLRRIHGEAAGADPEELHGGGVQGADGNLEQVPDVEEGGNVGENLVEQGNPVENVEERDLEEEHREEAVIMDPEELH